MPGKIKKSITTTSKGEIVYRSFE